MLDTQTIDIPFTGGLETKVDPVIVDKSRLLALSNASFLKNGTLQRRDAWTLLISEAGASPMELAALGNQLVSVDNAGRISSWLPSVGALAAMPGNVAGFSLSKQTIVQSAAASQSTPDCAHSSGLTCYVWAEYTGTYAVRYTIIDEATQAPIINDALIASTGANTPAPRVVAAGGNFLVTYINGSTLYLTSLYVGGIFAGPTAYNTDAFGGDGYIDACPVGTNNALVAYRNTSGNISAFVFGPNATAISSTIDAIDHTKFSGNATSVALAPFSSSSVALIAGNDGAASVQTAILSFSSPTLSVANAAATFSINDIPRRTTAVLEGSSVRVFTEPILPAAGSTKKWSAFLLSSSNAASGLTTPLYCIFPTGGVVGPLLAGKAFSSSVTGSAASYVPVRTVSTLQSSIYVVNASGAVQANALYGQSNTTLPNTGAPVPSTPTISTGVQSGAILIPAGQQARVNISFGYNATQLGVAAIYLQPGRNTSKANSTPLWHAQAANCLYFSGAFLGMYDGKQAAEAGFFCFPEGVTAAQAAGASSIAGTFQVVAVYEWVDAQGQRHQSAPSTAVSVTLSGTNGGITMTAPTLQLGVRASQCGVVFFRTVNGGTTFYRVNGVNSPLANSPSTGQVSYTDSTPTSTASADPIASGSGNEVLYTTGGALPNDLPSACNAIAAFQGRLVYDNAEDRQEWRFSQVAARTIGLQFSELLLGSRTPQDGGAINAFAVLDDKLILATPTQKFVVVGQGPDSTGSSNAYQPPQRLPSDVGVVDQRSLAVVPDTTFQEDGTTIVRPGGLIHQTQHGLYLLTRALTDNYVGEAVAAYAEGQAVTSAAVLANLSQARFTVPSQNVVLVYDFLFGQWSTFSSSQYANVQSGCVWNGLWTACNAGSVLQDSPGTYLDAGTTPIPVSFKTAWLHVSALKGYQRVRRAVFFGPYGSASTITGSAQINHDSTQQASMSHGTAGYASQDGTRWSFRWHQQQQKCEAIQFSMTDTPTGGNYSGVGFSGLTLELGVKRGTAKLQSAQST